MAEKISVQIALEGGAEVQRQLEGIGETGQKAFDDLAKSAEQVGGFKNLKTDEVTAGLKAAGVEGKELAQVLKAVGTAVKFETVVTGVRSVEAALVNLGKVAGVVGVAAAAAFAAMVKPTIAFAETIGKASDQAVKLGLSLEQFRNLQANFQKLGVSGEAAASGFAKFQQELQKAAQADPGSNLALFGQNAEVAQAELDKFLNRLRAMPDGLERTTLAIAKLGEVAGTQFIQGLRRAEGSMSADEAKAYDLQQALMRLWSAWSKFGNLTFAPALTVGIDAVTTAIETLTNALALGDFAKFEAGLTELLTKIGTFFSEKGVPIFLAAGQALTNALLTGIKEGITPSSLEGLFNTIAADFAKFGEGLVKNWEILKQKLSGGFISPAGAAEAGGADFGPTIAGAEVAAVRIKEIFAQAFTPTATIDFSGIVTAAQTAADRIGEIFSQIDISSTLSDQIDTLIQKFDQLATTAADAARAMASAGGGAGDGSAPGKARGGLIGGRGTGTSDSNLAWLSRGEHVMPAHVVRQPGMLGFLEALRRGGGIPGFQKGGTVGGLPFGAADFGQVFNKTIDLLKGAVLALRQLQQGFNNSMANVVRSIDSLASPFNQAIDGVVQTIVAAADTLQQLNQATGRARGGLLGGRGTGTSDSNLAWVSRGEYITPARAVAQPGVLAFLEALRRSGGNLSAVLDGMGRFALGGLVPRPAYAGGGAVGSMSHVTINFPGLEPIGGLRASAGVVEQLQRAAALAQVRSGGRKPSRYS